MVTIKNKSFNVSVGDNQQEVTYQELLLNAVRAIPQGGFSPEEMRARIRLLDVIDKTTESFEFEDADFAKLKPLVNQARWVLLDRQVITFVDYIESGGE